MAKGLYVAKESRGGRQFIGFFVENDGRLPRTGLGANVRGEWLCPDLPLEYVPWRARLGLLSGHAD